MSCLNVMFMISKVEYQQEMATSVSSPGCQAPINVIASFRDVLLNPAIPNALRPAYLASPSHLTNRGTGR